MDSDDEAEPFFSDLAGAKLAAWMMALLLLVTLFLARDLIGLSLPNITVETPATIPVDVPPGTNLDPA